MQRSDIDRLDARVNHFGASLFFDPVTIEEAAKRGVTDVVALVLGGRSGAIGDIGVSRLFDAFPFISPTMLEACWPGVEQAGGPVAMRHVFSGAFAAAASVRWDPVALQTIGATARDLIAPVDGVAPGLFAGWQSIALLVEPGGVEREIASLLALRELRGDIHIDSVRSVGLSPFEAEIATRGPLVAELHGWPHPDTDPEAFEQRSLEAGRRTSQRMAEIYDATLDDATLESLADALDNLVADCG
jgi:hypothetical protein